MDYEKKYKKALKRAKKIYDNAKELRCVVEAVNIETIFPELKESEDEKIREALINGVECCKASGWTNFGNNVDIDVVLAWLEKQGEQKSAWSDEDEENFRYCTEAIWTAHYYSTDDKRDMEAWLKSLKDRVKGKED